MVGAGRKASKTPFRFTYRGSLKITLACKRVNLFVAIAQGFPREGVTRRVRSPFITKLAINRRLWRPPVDYLLVRILLRRHRAFVKVTAR